MELMLLLLAMVLGATVSLLVVRYLQASSLSQLTFSHELMKTAMQTLDSKEISISRDRAVLELTKEMEKMNTVVGQLYLTVQNRTVLQKFPQVGEMPPGSPGRVMSRMDNPMSNPGPSLPAEMVDLPNSSPEEKQAQKTVFAAHT